jgi:hypothetical protein
MEKLDPRVNMSKTLIAEPILMLPYTLMLDPMRANDLIEKPLPTHT